MDTEKESPKEEASEEKEGVVIPEEFQQKVHELVKNASKHHLRHISDRVSARHDELRQEEMKKHKKNHPSEYSTADMPMN